MDWLTDPRLQADVLRYIDEYQWGWGMARKLINRSFSLQLTDCNLQRIYRAAKKAAAS